MLVPGCYTEGTFHIFNSRTKTLVVNYHSLVLNGAAKVDLITFNASWQHLSTIKEDCQTTL